jgi:hypothetical protein
MDGGNIGERSTTGVSAGSGTPLVLSIAARGTGMRATLVEIGTGSRTHIRNASLQPGAHFFPRLIEKRKQVEKLFQLGEMCEALVRMRELGRIVYDSVLSRIGLDRLFDQGGFAVHVRCEGEALHIPLEIAHNSRFLFERNVLTFRGTNDTPSETIPIRRALIVADPSGRFENAYREGRLLSEFLQNSGLTTTLIARPVSRVVFGELVGDFDILHFTGHAVTRKGCTGWDLGGEFFSSRDLLYRDSLPALVFSSSCGSTLHMGFDLLRAGVVNCVCSRWQIPDADMNSFILSFYRNLLRGLEIGLSLQRALFGRFRCGDVLPLVFVLQGECGVRYETSDTRRPH